MSDFGVLLSTGSGQPFITPASTPMALHGKYVINSTLTNGVHSVAGSIPWNPARPVMIFVKSTAVGTALGTGKTASAYLFSGTSRVGAFTLTAYAFGIFPQTMPDWGLCIWNGAGEVVLTNETRVLSDLVTVGQFGVSHQYGINMDITLPGSYAVCPVTHGAILFQVPNPSGPGPIIVPVTTYTSAAYINGTTRFTAASSDSPGGGSVGSIDSGCILTAINTAAYD